MSSRERVVAHTVIALVAASLLVPGVLGREYWPFLYYKMYAGLHSMSAGFTQIQVHGVPRDPGLPEFFLADEAWIDPFRHARLQPGLYRILVDNAKDPERIRPAVAYLFDHYEARRQAGLHDGPELRAVKVYQLDWKRLDPWARTVATPDRKRLLYVHPAGER